MPTLASETRNCTQTHAQKLYIPIDVRTPIFRSIDPTFMLQCYDTQRIYLVLW
jgi:hypothetical protein